MIITHFSGSFEDDLDVCELFCRIELFCEAWNTVTWAYGTGHWSIGQFMARGPPTEDIWASDTNQNVISGRKSFGNC